VAAHAPAAAATVAAVVWGRLTGSAEGGGKLWSSQLLTPESLSQQTLPKFWKFSLSHSGFVSQQLTFVHSVCRTALLPQLLPLPLLFLCCDDHGRELRASSTRQEPHFAGKIQTQTQHPLFSCLVRVWLSLLQLQLQDPVPVFCFFPQLAARLQQHQPRVRAVARRTELLSLLCHVRENSDCQWLCEGCDASFLSLRFPTFSQPPPHHISFFYCSTLAAENVHHTGSLLPLLKFPDSGFCRKVKNEKTPTADFFFSSAFRLHLVSSACASLVLRLSHCHTTKEARVCPWCVSHTIHCSRCMLPAAACMVHCGEGFSAGGPFIVDWNSFLLFLSLSEPLFPPLHSTC
jgi:hypothetical protein